jgi:osmotically-inducible protein OsmY
MFTIARARAARTPLLVALLLTSGCGALRRPLPTPDTTQDTRIKREVEARLANEPAIDDGSVRVAVDGAIVLLHGSVRGLAAWQCAITNAELVSGVRSVVEYLVIERGPREIRCLAPSTTP